MKILRDVVTEEFRKDGQKNFSGKKRVAKNARDGESGREESLGEIESQRVKERQGWRKYKKKMRASRTECEVQKTEKEKELKIKIKREREKKKESVGE